MRFLLVLLALATTDAALAQPPKGDGAHVEIIAPGRYCAAEMSGRTGDTWWVLYTSPADGPRLRYSPLTITPDPAMPGAYNVQADYFANADILLLFRGTPELPRGPVATCFQGAARLVGGTRLVLGTGAQQIMLGAIREQPSPDREAYAVVLANDTLQQDLLSNTWAATGAPAQEDTYNYPELRWAGDLDKDDRIDLFLNLSATPARSHGALYLSSRAEKEEVLHLVAEFKYDNCVAALQTRNSNDDH